MSIPNPNPEKVEIMRHSGAHILAAAVLKMFPDAKFGTGPVIENGFYYDVDLPRTLIPEDLPLLENHMREIIKSNHAFERAEIPVDVAIDKFKELDQKYKIEIISDLKKSGEEKVSVYETGFFVDLCHGPHIDSTGEIHPKAFKLTKISGAYWRADENREQLQRIYGVLFETPKELKVFEKQQEEALKRDHRKIGEELELFMISEEVGKGLPLWLPNGAFIRNQLEEYMYQKERLYGYKLVNTPILTHKRLYEKSGHLSHYRDDMYNPIDIEGEEYYLRPMNCPHHHQIFKKSPKSYRDLPLRLAEFGLVHRFERSGVLTGLIRARCFTQNDSHIYCRRSQIKDEILSVLNMFKEVYADFGIANHWFRLSLPDFENNPEKYGDVEDKTMWHTAGELAREALEEYGAKYTIGMGEASFYGPKIDVQIKNVFGKEDTIATVQLDFYSAGRFDLVYVNEQGEKEPVVIIHRAIMGSFDRFFAFLIEHYAGAFPVWLSPVQVAIAPVSEKFSAYALEVAQVLKNNDIRVEIFDQDDSLGKRIREASKQKIPYTLVIGEKEVGSKTVTIRDRSNEKEQITTSADEFVNKVLDEIKERK